MTPNGWRCSRASATDWQRIQQAVADGVPWAGDHTAPFTTGHTASPVGPRREPPAIAKNGVSP